MTRASAVACILLVPLTLCQAARAALIDAFSGYVDLAGVRAEQAGLERESLRQDYNLVFGHGLSPYVDLRAALRYYRIDQELEAALGGYNEELVPSGELRYSHPLFNLSGIYRQRRVRST